MKMIPVFLGKSKISNDCLAFLQENVRQFEISMKEATFCNMDESTNNFLGELNGFTLIQPFLFFDECSKISSFAEVSDDKTRRWFSNNIETF